jgi:hypothetical protein
MGAEWLEGLEQVYVGCTLCTCHSVPGRIVCDFSPERDCIEIIYTGTQIYVCSYSQAAVPIIEEFSKLV